MQGLFSRPLQSTNVRHLGRFQQNFFRLSTQSLSSTSSWPLFFCPSFFSTSSSSSSSSSEQKDLTKYMTPLALRREASPIREVMKFLSTPGLISLGGGLPNPGLFPFSSLNFTLSDGTTITPSESEFAEALQYSPTPGLPRLLQALRIIQCDEHGLDSDSDDWTMCVTTGSQEALTRAFDMLIQAGDNVLVENPTYTGALSYLRPMGANLIPCEVDSDGLVPDSILDQILKLKAEGKKLPSVLYTIPTGQNPGGTTLTEQRKRDIYSIACDHDIIILEDDPYRFLHYGDADAPSDDNTSSFSRCRDISFTSLDTQDRVIRFDSLSKVLSAGVRIGFATGPTAFIQRMDLHGQSTSLHTSGVSQLMIYKLLEHWGPQGWAAQCNKVSLFYMQRRDVFIKACERHLTGLATWTTPSAGMFGWLKLLPCDDSSNLIREKAIAAKVLLLPGDVFDPEGAAGNYVRASFSTASPEQIDEAIQRFASLIKSEYSL